MVLRRAAAWMAVAAGFAAGAPGAGAADAGARTYPDPACSERNVNPERCVINDGAPVRLGTVRTEPIAAPPGGSPQGGTPATSTSPSSTPTLRKGWK